MSWNNFFVPRQWWRDMSLPAMTAGFVAALVAMSSSAAIIFAAARAFGAGDSVVASWIWAVCVGSGLASLVPSLVLRKPVMIAWSTPGAVVLATAAADGDFHMSQAVGAFMVCSLLITWAGVSGWFERIMHRIPMSVAAALLAGVLARFALQAFSAAGTMPVLVVSMLLVYLLCKRLLPRYAVVATLLAGVAYAGAYGLFDWSALRLDVAVPVFTFPSFSLMAIVSLALPLFIVTMASQNVPGVVAAKAAGYELPVSPLVTMTGFASLVLAPLGCFALNLSAITASICMGPEAHPDPARRYMAAVCWGLWMVLLGVFGVVVTGLLVAFPQQLIQAIAGLALLSTIGSSLLLAVEDEEYLEAAVVTFLVTLSGVKLLGIDSTVWGGVAGVVALLIQNRVPHLPGCKRRS